jgi:amidohydrolase
MPRAVGSHELITDTDGQLGEQMRSWRRTIHAHPETAYEEFATAKLVAAALQESGIRVHTGIARTGVVGVLQAGNGGRSIALRADMDALHIQELNDFAHRSLHDGRMHACGHDGHTATLLGAAAHLARTRNFEGTVYLVFQPAEENEGGGRRMVEEGLFEHFPVDAVFGLHNLPGLPVGCFSLLSGPVLASFDIFEIRISGKGGHAAMPQHVIDPIVIGSQLVGALQTIVSRSLDPLESGVVSVTSLHAGDTWNVVPDEAVLRGSVRAFDEPIQARIEERLRALTTGICTSFGASATVKYERRYPPTVNWPEQTEAARRVVVKTFGADSLTAGARPLMASEDFSYMLREKPGCFALLGNGVGAGSTGLHNPHYDFNDELLGWGATYWVRLVEDLLAPANLVNNDAAPTA